jgi:DtxR family Mn-dependent transcriptional regulator
VLSITEENYLKALLSLTLEEGGNETGTNRLALHLGIRPATVNDMLKKLKAKKLVNYEKYGKIRLSADGRRQAMKVLRKHRLWETFLYEKLDFSWDEVHEVAEQLEHIQSEKLIEKLDKFLGFPKTDPHGDVIPDAKGTMAEIRKLTLTEVKPGQTCELVAVKDNSAAFLQYVSELGIGLRKQIRVISRVEFDSSMQIEVNRKTFYVSQKFCDNLLVR